MISIIIVMMVVISATMTYAGFLDGLKKIGGGVVEAAGGAFDSSINVTTNAVQSISSSTVLPAGSAQQPEADTRPVTSVKNSAKQDSVKTVSERKPTQYELEQERRKRNEEERERRYQAEQERQRVGREKYQAEQAAREKTEREERIAKEKIARDEADRKRAEQESREKAARERANQEAMAQRQTIADKEAKENAEMIQAMKDTVAMLKELHDSPELDEFVKWDDENNSRFHGSQYVGHTARERAYNKIRREGLMDISGYDIIAIDHLPAETLADVPEYMLSVDGSGGISIPKTAKSAESYKAAISKLLSEEREIVRKKKEVVERAAKERADSEKTERDALAKAHETIANIHAEAAGSPDGYQFKPVTVFRKVHLGMSAKEVYEALDMKDAEKFLEDASDYKKWNYGKAIKVTLPSHTLHLQFAYITGDGKHEQYMLVSAQLEFNDKENAPDAATVCSKYEQLKGVKVSKDRRVTGLNWKDGVNAFWHTLYDTAMFQVAMTEQTGTGEHGPLTDEDKVAHKRLKLDLESIREEYMTPTYESIDVFSVDGMQVRVISSMESKTTTLITFEDGLISDKLVKLKERANANKAKAAAEAKATAEKKAKAAAVDF